MPAARLAPLPLGADAGAVADRWETGREVAVLGGLHRVALALEPFMVSQGPRSGGVPLYRGFVYAAVGSYVCQA